MVSEIDSFKGKTFNIKIRSSFRIRSYRLFLEKKKNRKKRNLFEKIGMDLIKRNLAWMSILPGAKNTNGWTKLRNYFLSIFSFALEMMGLVASVAFFYKFVAIDLASSLQTILQAAAFISTSYSISVGFRQRYKIQGLFPKFQAFHDKCNLGVEVVFRFCFIKIHFSNVQIRQISPLRLLIVLKNLRIYF